MQITNKKNVNFFGLCFDYFKSRFLVIRKFYKECLGFLILAAFLFYSEASKHGFEQTIIESEKYFLIFGIVFINVFTFPLFTNFNEKINLYYRFYEVKLFDYIQKKLPKPIRYMFNIFYFVLLSVWFLVYLAYSALWMIFLPMFIWAYLYVNLLMTKIFKIFPADYYFIEYLF